MPLGFSAAVVGSAPTSMKFDHVAIIANVYSDSLTLLDATPERGVALLEYSNLCETHRWSYNIAVMRIDIPTQAIEMAVNIGMQYISYEYNDIFADNFINSHGKHSFYCSQLVQYIFNKAAGRVIFGDIFMNFQNHNGNLSAYWLEYYDARGMDVPQGANGTHPSSIYESEFLMCF